ncbi:hypothetical protein PG996_006141 [Apiospora saccharicola]|uniref:Uncharacterized protein n=1 Tax=Apiospora saccharicola TaxID=335842 RepID=A0ABR1VNG1_9PEZI
MSGQTTVTQDSLKRMMDELTSLRKDELDMPPVQPIDTYLEDKVHDMSRDIEKLESRIDPDNEEGLLAKIQAVQTHVTLNA